MTISGIKPVKIIPKYLAYILLVSIGSLILTGTVCGLNRDLAVTQFHHTAWTAKDGAPGQIRSIAQTNDGFLWLGTGTGLYRFDGALFEPYTPPGEAFPSSNISSLLASPDGGLWISYWFGGISFLKDGRLTNYGANEGLPPGSIAGMTIDHENTVWVAASGGLARFKESRWEVIGAEWNYPDKGAQAVFVDRQGTLWVAAKSTVVFLPEHARSFQTTGEQINQLLRFAQSPDGTLWAAETSRAVRQIPLQPGADSKSLGPELRIGSMSLLFDRNGSLWAPTMGDGIRRLANPDQFRGQTITEFGTEAEIFTEKDGLSADYVYAVFEDREGAIWFGTGSGLDRFRESNLVPVRFPPGYQDFGLARGTGGDVWTITSNRFPNLIHGSTPAEKKLSKYFSGAISTDEEGAVWMDAGQYIFRILGSEVSKLDKGIPTKDAAVAIFKDRDGIIWDYIFNEGTFLFKDGRWTPYERQAELPGTSPNSGAVDSMNRKWFGYTNNKLAVIDGDQIRTFSSDDGLQVGAVKMITESNGHLWVGGSLGLAVLEGNRFRMAIAGGAENFKGLSGLVETVNGDLWLNATRGIIMVPHEEVSRSLADANYQVRYRIFDFLDGLPGSTQQTRPSPTAIEGTDGRLWFSTTRGLVWINPAQVAANPLPPPVLIRSLSADGQTYEPKLSPELPKGTTSLKIDYTALSLSIPERVNFRYRLEGVDKDWKEAETRRDVSYNNLGPGNYRFRVIACNNDGLWNEEGALLQFSIAPLFYQTRWFVLLCGATAIIFIWLIYSWRIRYVKSRLRLQFEQRLAERMRIAQELHDTLLQSVFSASMQLDAAVEQLSENSPIKSKLDHVSELMIRVMVEGRNTIRGLHSPDSHNALILENAFAELKREFEARDEIDFQVIVKGANKVIHPIVRDEIYRLGREALANAFRHAKADAIEVEIEYAPKSFKFWVRDNGCGIDQKILDHGREGHLGLSGMRDCAQRIGGKLKILSRERGGGTEIELIVPDHIAYKKEAERSIFTRLRNPFRQPPEGKDSDKEQEENEK